MLGLLLGLAMARAQDPSLPRWTLSSETVAAVRAVADRPIGERIDAATRGWLGLPYQNEITGEGAGPDGDAPARYDRFDCMSLLEEALGMTLAGDPLGAPAIRDALRYAGPVGYTSRNHFMEAQWIPNAIASGLLEDITDRVGPARTLQHEVTLATWNNWRGRRRFQLLDTELPLGTWSVRYLDLAAAAEAVPRIPPGAVVVTMRVPRPWSPVITTHVSLVIPGATEPMMRHATRMGKQLVRDDRLSWYMMHLRDYVNWPALGVMILMPREQGPTRAALLPSAVPATRFPDAGGELPHFVPQPLAPLQVGDDPA